MASNSIIIDSRRDSGGGIKRYIENLIHYMYVSNLDFFTISNVSSDNTLSKMIIKDNSHYYSYNYNKIYEDFNFIKNNNVVLHCTNYMLPYQKIRAKKIATIHDVFRLLEPKLCYNNTLLLRRFGKHIFNDLQLQCAFLLKKKKIRQVYKKLEDLITPNLHHTYLFLRHIHSFLTADIVIVPSETVKKDIVEVLGFNNCIEIVPHGINHIGLYTGNNKQYPLPKKQFLLYVGQDRSHKNLQKLIDIFKLLKKRKTELALVIISEHKSPVGEDVYVYNNISDNFLYTLYQKALCLIHLALYEGFGFTPLEAFLHGTPVISLTQNKATQEFLGPLGIYIPDKSIEKMADKIYNILSNSTFLSEDVKAKRIHHSQHFTWEQSIKATRKIYNQLQ